MPVRGAVGRLDDELRTWGVRKMALHTIEGAAQQCAGADQAIAARIRRWFRLCGLLANEVAGANPPGSSAPPLGGYAISVTT